ncbi:hypothetical protein AB0937_32690 [Streptomyces sp. NPDC047880]|uniref:hypothetical protein n=1 Tax=Streptomyces sp. NPDC047880 TaxID=3155626 RepID=UPI0034569F5E
MKRIAQIFGVAAAALLVGTLTTSPAQAAVSPGCKTTGADGFIFIPTFDGAVSSLELEWHITDTLADDHHARIRFLSKQHNGKTHYWPWHKATGGKGDHEYASTTARDDYGIFEVGAEVARFEGNRKLNSCIEWS